MQIEIKASRWLVNQSGYALLAFAEVLFILELHTNAAGLMKPPGDDNESGNRNGACDDEVHQLFTHSFAIDKVINKLHNAGKQCNEQTTQCVPDVKVLKLQSSALKKLRMRTV